MEKRTRIFYFSGTGNSLLVARQLAERLGGAGLYAMAGPPCTAETHRGSKHCDGERCRVEYGK